MKRIPVLFTVAGLALSGIAFAQQGAPDGRPPAMQRGTDNSQAMPPTGGEGSTARPGDSRTNPTHRPDQMKRGDNHSMNRNTQPDSGGVPAPRAMPDSMGPATGAATPGTGQSPSAQAPRSTTTQ